MPRFEKGSQEAKDYMRKLRESKIKGRGYDEPELSKPKRGRPGKFTSAVMPHGEGVRTTVMPRDMRRKIRGEGEFRSTVMPRGRGLEDESLRAVEKKVKDQRNAVRKGVIQSL